MDKNRKSRSYGLQAGTRDNAEKRKHYTALELLLLVACFYAVYFAGSFGTYGALKVMGAI